MEHHCPVCAKDVGRRKLNRALVAGLAIDCPHCMHKIHLNIHRAEALIVMFNFAAILVLGVFAWWFRSRGFALAALGAVMFGALALPLLEHTLLRRWPRYARGDADHAPPSAGPES